MAEYYPGSGPPYTLVERRFAIAAWNAWIRAPDIAVALDRPLHGLRQYLRKLGREGVIQDRRFRGTGATWEQDE